MQAVRRTEDSTAAWEIARPSRAAVLTGVDMAGFRIRGVGPVGLRAIPHPAVTVAVEFGGRPFDIGHDGGGEGDGSGEGGHGGAGRLRAGSLTAGLAFRAFEVRAEDVECVQIRLSPLVAHPVLGLPLGELRGSVLALDDLWGPAAPRLRERLHEASGWPERFALIDQELTARLRAGRAADPEVAWVWEQIVASRGRARVADLADRIGWSRQRTWSRFGAQIGLPPKRAARLVRFDHAVHRLAEGRPPTEVAAEGGYADQSHLHHEIRDFTGTTPVTAAGEPWLAADERAWPTRSPLPAPPRPAGP